MAVLSLYLPPFSPDYSGVSAVLFDLKTVTAMHDASGCTGNYTSYDEPRWYGSRAPIYCSGLREIDAILGDDDKLVQKMLAAAEDLQPDLMALVGSPVPMVIGSDLVGIAAELEVDSGIPCFGFDTTGTAYYDYGANMAITALLKRFTEPMEPVPGTVNILGATPMDFGDGANLKDLREFLEGAGLSVTASLAMGYDLESLKASASAEVNLAVTRTGLWVARFMEQEYGIPYLCGQPIGSRQAEEYLRALETVRRERRSMILNGEPCQEPDVLIVGEQVQSNAIRLALSRECGIEHVAVGCLYGLEADLALPQDRDLSSEREIREELRKDHYRTVIADPLLRDLLSADSRQVFRANPQYAVSSKLGGRSVRLIADHFNHWVQE